jgi:hypothetical protein
MRLTPANYLAEARKNNPKIRYALRKEPAVSGGGVLGAFCTNAGGFIPVAFESEKNGGIWTVLIGNGKSTGGFLEIDGKAVGIEPENWQE